MRGEIPALTSLVLLNNLYPVSDTKSLTRFYIISCRILSVKSYLSTPVF